MARSSGCWGKIAAGGAMLLLLGLAGCSAGGGTASSSAPATTVTQAQGASHAGGGASAVLPSSGSSGATSTSATSATSAVPAAAPDIIRTGAMTLLVGRTALEGAFQSASDDATGAGGYVQSTDSQLAGTSKPYADLTIRVPASDFDGLVTQLGTLGKLQQKSLGGQDVTGQVVDLGARIANLDAEEGALRQLISRAGSIPDILAVENELFSVEQQVEELTAQRDDLVGQVAYATLTVEIVVAPLPAPKPKPKPAPSNAVARGARIALHNTAAVLHSVALGIGEAFPALLLVVVAGLGLLVVRRRRGGAGHLPPPRTAD